MAVIFRTNDPKGLLEAFNDRIDQKDKEGKINTWKRNSDGYYTHKSEQYGGKAGFRPIVTEPIKGVDGKKNVPGILRFNLHSPQDGTIERQTYSYYHGHLIEAFLNHFENMFTYVTASAKPMKK